MLLLCVCVGGGGGGEGKLENNFVRQCISLNIFKHETFSLIDKYGKILLNCKT